MSHYGVDVSSNNAHPINWQALGVYLEHQLGGGQPFAIIKINEGSYYVNPDAWADITYARDAGFAVAGYLMDAGSSDPAAEEALYRKIAGSLPQLDDDELPDGLSASAYKAHLAQLNALAPAVQYLNQSEVVQGYPEGNGLWLAQYNGQPGVTSYPALIHQYTSLGNIPNAAGAFDLNFFMGSEAQFASLFELTPPPSPTPAPGPTFGTPTKIPGDESLMNVDFSTTTGADGTAYVPVPIPAECTHIVSASADVAYPFGQPPHHDLDVDTVDAAGTRDASGVVAQPVVGGTPPAGTQFVRLTGAAQNHFYTGHAVFA